MNLFPLCTRNVFVGFLPAVHILSPSSFPFSLSFSRISFSALSCLLFLCFLTLLSSHPIPCRAQLPTPTPLPLFSHPSLVSPSIPCRAQLPTPTPPPWLEGWGCRGRLRLAELMGPAAVALPLAAAGRKIAQNGQMMELEDIVKVCWRGLLVCCGTLKDVIFGLSDSVSFTVSSFLTCFLVFTFYCGYLLVCLLVFVIGIISSLPLDFTNHSFAVTSLAERVLSPCAIAPCSGDILKARGGHEYANRHSGNVAFTASTYRWNAKRAARTAGVFTGNAVKDSDADGLWRSLRQLH